MVCKDGSFVYLNVSTTFLLLYMSCSKGLIWYRRNNALWTKDKCFGKCQISSYGSVSGISGFSQYNCDGELQMATNIGFWCYWGAGDGAVMMIGGGGSSCARADHGIGITEENEPRFGSIGTMDFGDNSAGSRSYALNLWIR